MYTALVSPLWRQQNSSSPSLLHQHMMSESKCVCCLRGMLGLHSFHQRQGLFFSSINVLIPKAAHFYLLPEVAELPIFLPTDRPSYFMVQEMVALVSISMMMTHPNAGYLHLDDAGKTVAVLPAKDQPARLTAIEARDMLRELSKVIRGPKQGIEKTKPFADLIIRLITEHAQLEWNGEALVYKDGVEAENKVRFSKS